jgi:hypothetical protein
MKFASSPIFPLVFVVVIAFLGILGGIDSVQQPTAIVYIASLAAVGLCAVGMGEWRVKIAPKAVDASLPSDVQVLDRETESVLEALQTFSQANGSYSESLAQAGRSLLSLANLDSAQAIVRLLTASNKRMQSETEELSRKLETSRLQVANLSSRLSEAEDIGFRDALRRSPIAVFSTRR